MSVSNIHTCIQCLPSQMIKYPMNKSQTMMKTLKKNETSPVTSIQYMNTLLLSKIKLYIYNILFRLPFISFQIIIVKI